MNDKTLKFKIESEGLEKIREATKEIKNDLEEINKCFKNRCEYEIVTKEQFVKEYLCNIQLYRISPGTRDMLEKRWEKISDGFNFVIKAGNMHYSVNHFNNKILGNDNA